MSDYGKMTEIEQIMLSDKFTIFLSRNGYQFDRWGWFLSAEDAIISLVSANEDATICCVLKESEEKGVSIVNLDKVFGG